MHTTPPFLPDIVIGIVCFLVGILILPFLAVKEEKKSRRNFFFAASGLVTVMGVILVCVACSRM